MKVLQTSSERYLLNRFRGLSAGLQPADEGQPVPRLPLEGPVVQHQLHKRPLLLDGHLVQDAL